MSNVISLKINVADLGTTKTLQCTGDMSVHELCNDIREKCGQGSGGSDHGLFWADTGKWLVPSKVLDFYDLKSGDKLDFKKKHRVLKVKTLDESVKQILIDDSALVADLVVVVCERMGIHNPEEYSFAFDIPPAGSPAKPMSPGKKAPVSPVSKLVSPSKDKVKVDEESKWINPDLTLSEQGLTVEDPVVLKKKFFFTDQNIDRNDPIQLNLLYNQSKEMIVSGKHPCTIEEAAQFGAIQCQVQYGNYEPDKHKASYIKVKELVPPEYRNAKDIVKKINTEHSKLQGLSELNAKFRYVQLSRSLKTYGISFFAVKERHPKKNKMVDVLLGVTKQSIVRLDAETKDIIKSWPLTQLRRWAAATNSFTLDFGDYADSYYTVQTAEGEQISQLIAGYIDIILKKRKEADKVVPVEEKPQFATEEYIRPGKAVNVGVVSAGPKQAVETRVGNLLSVSTTPVARPAFVRKAPQFQFGSPTSVVGPPKEITGAQQALIQAIKNGFSGIVSAASDIEIGLVLPPLGDSPAALQWKQQTIETNAEAVASHIASHLASAGAIINNATGDVTSMDYETMETKVTILTSNMTHMANGLKMLTALSGEEGDKEIILDASRALSKATANFLDAIQPIVQGQPNKEQLFLTARDIAITSSDMLTLIGRLDISEEMQNDIIESARGVAKAVADVVSQAKKVAELLTDPQDQLELAAHAKSAAEAANQVVAITTVVSPAVSVQICLDQVMEASVSMKDSLSGLVAAASPCSNAKLVTALREVVQKVEEAIAKLLDVANSSGTSFEENPLDNDLDQVINAAEHMIESSKTTDGIIACAKELTLAATQMVNSLKKAGLSHQNEDERERFLAAARSIADCTSKMVFAAKEAARFPADSDKHNKLVLAINNLKRTATESSGTDLQSKSLMRLNKAVKNVLASQNQLLVAAKNVATANRNQASQIEVNRCIKKITEHSAAWSMALKAHTANPDDKIGQSTLLAAANNIVPALAALIAATNIAAPTAGEASSQAHLMELTKQASSDLHSLERNVDLVETVNKGLQLESALVSVNALKADIRNIEPGTGFVGRSSVTEFTVESAQVALAENVKGIHYSIAQLVSASSQGNEKLAGTAATEAITALQSITVSSTALQSLGATDLDLKSSIQTAATNVADTLAALISSTKSGFDGQQKDREMEILTKMTNEAIARLVTCLPGQRDLENALKLIEDIAVTLSSATIFAEGERGESYTTAQNKLQAAAGAFTVSANTLSTATRGTPIELQNASRNFGTCFEKLVNAIKAFCSSCGDEALASKLLESVKHISGGSTKLVKCAKLASGDVSNISLRNELFAAVAEVGDAINELIELCSASAPGHNDCNSALQILVSALSKLNALNDGSSSDFSYNESIAKITDSSKQIPAVFNGVLLSARSAAVQKMAQDLVFGAQIVATLTEGTSRATYLIGITDPNSSPATPSIIDQNTFVQAGIDIKNSCKRLIDPKNTQPQILELAANIAKHTSKICNSCKMAGIDPVLGVSAKQSFVSFAKEVALKTSGLVASIKQLAVSQTEDARTKASSSSTPLLEVVDKLVSFALSPEFTAIPAKLSPAATAAQKPLIEANRSVISATQDVINTAKLLCSDPHDSSTLQLMATEIRCVTDSVQGLIEAVSNGAPGQKECSDAIQSITETVGSLDAAIMDATVNNLQPTQNVPKDTLVETSRALASLVDVIARSITSDISQLAHSIAELPGNFKLCVAYAIGVASNTQEMTTQISILNDTKQLCDTVQRFVLAVKKSSIALGDQSIESTIEIERASVRQAVTRLTTAVEGSRDESGEFAKAAERIESIVSTLETQIPIQASHTYQILCGEIENLGKQLVDKVSDIITKVKSADKFREASKGTCDLYNQIVTIGCEAVSASGEAKTRQALLSELRQLGGSTIRLIESMRLASAKSAADHVSRLKLGQSGRDVSSSISNLIAAAKDGSRGVMVCQQAVGHINDLISDLEATYIFAQAGNLDPIDSKDTFTKHKDNLLSSAKALTEVVKNIITSVVGTQDELANVATNAVNAIESLRLNARSGAISLTSGDKHMQQQLLAASKYVAENLQTLLQTAVHAVGKRSNDPAMIELGDSVKLEFTALAELVRVTKSLGDETTRGVRAVEGAVHELDEILQILESDTPAQGTALPDEVAQVAKQLATTVAAVVVASSGVSNNINGKQDELVAATNAVRKQVEDLVRAGRAATEKAPEEVRSKVLNSIKKAIVATRGLMNGVSSMQGESSANKANLQTSAREVAFAVGDIVTAVEALIPGGYIDPNDPNVIAERELLNAASAIEAASKKLAALAATVPPKPKTGSHDELNFDEQILEAAKAIATATGALVRSATGAQREIVAKQSKMSSNKEMYFSDGTWSEGLVSAAKMVAAATGDLCEAANQAVKGNIQRENVIASAKAVSSSTAQLLAAAAAKTDPNSQVQIRLRAAGRGVTNATEQLVKAAEQALAFDDSEQMTALSRTATSAASAMAMEMDAQVSILKMEKELEKARAKLAAVRRGKYEKQREGK